MVVFNYIYVPMIDILLAKLVSMFKNKRGLAMAIKIKKMGIIGVIISTIILIIANRGGDAALGCASGASVIMSFMYITYADKIVVIYNKINWRKDV